jgi:hypothetical protein
MNIGTEFGQLKDRETWEKFWDLLQELDAYEQIMTPEDYDYYSDPNALTLEKARAMSAAADSMYQKILDSEVPYSLPNGDGYYRIFTQLCYYKNVEIEEGVTEKEYMRKAILAPTTSDKAMWGTLQDKANFVWKLTQHGDSIEVQNVGMGSYISTEAATSGRVNLSTDETKKVHVVFDYGGEDIVVKGDGDEDLLHVFNIRLASKARHEGNYVHQLNHNKGVDSGVDQELSFWNSTYGKEQYNNDGGASEWYLEPVSEDEVARLIAEFTDIKEHDILVAANNELRAKVSADLIAAKDSIRTSFITAASQLSSPNSDEAEGTNIGALIDNDGSTFWHTSWHSSNNYPRVSYAGVETHYLQISGMENMVGDCRFYFRERSGADNDRPSKIVIMGTNELPEEPEDPSTYVDDCEGWVEIATLTIPHTGAGEENTIPLYVEQGFSYIRLFAIEVNSSFRTFWHAAEIQFSKVEPNPNSQYVAMGEIAETLERLYKENVATPDAEITQQMYDELLKAYNAFLGGMVDPAELRNALAKYADTTKGVVEGTQPGQWTSTDIATEYDKLYQEAKDYDEAGRYTAEKSHMYAVMLKAMAKTVMEKANGIKTDKWYRIMFPTEEMYDAYGFSKDGGDKTSLIEDQATMFGTFVTAANEISEEVAAPTDENPDAVATEVHLEAIGGEDLRESDRLFFMADDEIEDKDASMFRFVEQETDGADYTSLLQDTKDNMSMALDMSTTYTQGEALITSASQFTSNAPYPGNDGQKLESGCLIDGDFSTFWHSDYSRTYCAVPYLQVALNEPVSGLIQLYVGRRNTNNGHVVRMYVQGSNDAENWTRIGYIETPFIDASTPVTSQPIDLGGTFSHLRFTMTNRSGSDGGSNIEFDPFAEDLTADDYNTKFTYFHASEFQIYPVTPTAGQSESAWALQQAYTTANKVVLKDATAEDLAAASQAYKAFKAEFNSNAGKPVLPDGADKAPASYVLQNKATGLFVMVSGTGNQNNVYLKTVPTIVGYKAISYQRSLLSAKNVKGESCNYLHGGESNRRLCTWGTTEPTTNSGLVICEADAEYEAPAEFTYLKDIKPGRINAWCNSVTVTPTDVPEGAVAYTPLGQYTVGEDEDAETYLALKAIDVIPAGEPAFFIYGDTLEYNEDNEDEEPVKFTISGNEKIAVEGATLNGVTASLVNHNLEKFEIYFSGNHAVCIGETGYYLSGPCVVLNMEECPQVDPDGDYDFSIYLGESASEAEELIDGVKNISTAIEKISKPGNVYSIDGKLLRTGATLNSLKSLGKGMYILNGVKVAVK